MARELGDHWTVGLEARNKQVFGDTLGIQGDGTSAWFSGPCVTYRRGDWWALLSVQPQITGSGDGTSGGLQLDENERIEVRLGFGYVF